MWSIKSQKKNLESAVSNFRCVDTKRKDIRKIKGSIKAQHPEIYPRTEDTKLVTLNYYATWTICQCNQCDTVEYEKAEGEAAGLKRQYKTSGREWISINLLKTWVAFMTSGHS